MVTSLPQLSVAWRNLFFPHFDILMEKLAHLITYVSKLLRKLTEVAVKIVHFNAILLLNF